MYYFLKKTDFNLENYDFAVELSTKLSKKEQEVFKLLLKNYKNEEKFSVLDISSCGVPEYDLKKLIESIMKKIMKCEFKMGNTDISMFYFNIFGIIAFENGELIYDFSEGIKNSLGTHNIYNRVGITSHLQFVYSYTKVIYNLILKENKHKGFIELSLKELKNLLGIGEDKYSRFYDFETKVLNPIAKDIEVSENYIWFEKIKDHNSKNSRITGVKIHYSNLYHINLHKETNNLLRLYADYVEDFASAYKKIYQHIKENNIDITKDFLEKNYKEFFEILP